MSRKQPTPAPDPAMRPAPPTAPPHVALPCNQLHNLRRRVNRARDKAWPKHTCPASRHVHLVANELLRWNVFANFDEHHAAESMLFVLESLWKARMELAKLKEKR